MGGFRNLKIGIPRDIGRFAPETQGRAETLGFHGFREPKTPDKGHSGVDTRNGPTFDPFRPTYGESGRNGSNGGPLRAPTLE